MTTPHDSSTPVLTIDGPSGSGKGTISRLVAQSLGWHYLDSGALYRAVGVAAGWADIDLADPAALVRCAFDTRIGFRDDERGELRVLVNDQDATDEGERARLISDITRLIREPQMPETTRTAGLTLIGWLARRMPGEAPHAIGVAEARQSERRVRAAQRKTR